MSNIIEYGKEAAEIAAQTVLSVIPVGGALITAIWDSVKANAANKRLEEWKELLEEKLSHVEKTLEEIGNNELFTSCIMKATDAALRTAQKEKRRYLANAVYNSAIIDLDENVAMIFLDMVERYTELHIRVLHFFKDPTAFPGISVSKYYQGSAMVPLFDAYPDLKNQKELVNKIAKDLYSDGLMNTESLAGMMSAVGMVSKRATQFGDEFLSFILT